MKASLLVSAALLRNDKGHVLLAERPTGKLLAGMWEFPGGKVEENEPPELALVRELREELAIEVDVADLKPLTFVTHAYNHFHLLMLLYHCTRWQGTPHGREGQALRWVAPTEMAALPMPPADLPLVEYVRKSFSD
jgi:8-oxo-dGTP diphosphatase